MSQKTFSISAKKLINKLNKEVAEKPPEFVELRILLLKERIKERSLIRYVIETNIDHDLPKDYKICMRDEVKNHSIAIREYKQEITKLKKQI